ncbi:Biotin synthase [bioreactor metagenome]|uniref:Biotin synthase n=1 Tax=bioreactor metagenome TaxID=1076179 RepID=A0A645ATX4_9ZZZZ
MNLQTNPDRYAELIASTHSVVAKIQTICYLQKYGVSICCGGIFGLGESWEDRVKMAVACRDLEVDGIPLNVLLPIKGTPLENLPVMEPAEVAKAFAIFRLVNPAKMLKFAAGRETTMKDFQGLLMLAGMNSMITGGYLTTRGRSVAEDREFLERLARFTDND